MHGRGLAAKKAEYEAMLDKKQLAGQTFATLP
jgi:hypothetical protein